MKQAVRDRLAELHASVGGWSIDEIIADARKRSSPLHGEFEWDKAKAHEIYLRERARKLIRDWYVEQQLGNEQVVRVRRAVSIAVDDQNGKPSRRYYPLEHVLSDEVMTQLMLTDALRELSAFRRKYQHLTALAKVFEAIDSVASNSGQRDYGSAEDRVAA